MTTPPVKMKKTKKATAKKLCCIPEVNKGNTFFRCRGVKIIDLGLVCRPHSPCRPLLTVSGRCWLLHDVRWRPCCPCRCGGSAPRCFPPRDKNRLVLGGCLSKVREESWLFPEIMGGRMKGDMLLSSCCRRHCRRGSLLWTGRATESLSNGLTDSYCVILVSIVLLFDENATMTASQTRNIITNECHCLLMLLSLNIITVIDVIVNVIVLKYHCPWMSMSLNVSVLECHCPWMSLYLNVIFPPAS